jgi:cell division protein FtsB
MDLRMKNGRQLKEFVRKNLAAILALSLLAIFVHDLFGEHGFLAMRRMQKELEKLDAEIHGLNDENQKLADQVQALKSDPKAIERIAREEMGLARPGELIFKLPPKSPPQQKPNPPQP